MAAKAEKSDKKDSQKEKSTKTKSIRSKDLFVWKAPARPFKKRDKNFWTTVLAIAVIFGLILLVIDGVMPVILIISIIFLYYVMTTVEPEEIEYKITRYGVEIAGKETPWEVLTRYWFTRRFSSDLMVFEMTVFPGRLEIVVNKDDIDKIKKITSEYLLEEEATPSNLDKAANWFTQKLPQS